jgi:hypothetical protein
MWHSSYFAAALDPKNGAKFVKASTKELTLQEDAEVFEAFRCWIYTGKLKDIPSTAADATTQDQYLSAMILCKIWVFADMRGIPALGNSAIDMLHELVCSKWTNYPHELLKYTYQNTTSGSKLRKYLVSSFTKLRGYGIFMEEMTEERVTIEFLLDAIPVLVRQGNRSQGIGKEEWSKLDRCEWHDHSGPGGKLRLESRK